MDELKHGNWLSKERDTGQPMSMQVSFIHFQKPEYYEWHQNSLSEKWHDMSIMIPLIQRDNLIETSGKLFRLGI